MSNKHAVKQAIIAKINGIREALEIELADVLENPDDNTKHLLNGVLSRYEDLYTYLLKDCGEEDYSSPFVSGMQPIQPNYQHPMFGNNQFASPMQPNFPNMNNWGNTNTTTLGVCGVPPMMSDNALVTVIDAATKKYPFVKNFQILELNLTNSVKARMLMCGIFFISQLQNMSPLDLKNFISVDDDTVKDIKTALNEYYESKANQS